MHHPEKHGVHIKRHEVIGEGLLGPKGGGANAGVYPHGAVLDKRDSKKETGAFYGVQFAKAQNHDAFPLLSYMHAGNGKECHGGCDYNGPQPYALAY